MKLIYKGTTREVKVGDVVADPSRAADGVLGVVHYFRPPHKPSSSGKVTVQCAGAMREYYVSVIGAEWVEREDR